MDSAAGMRRLLCFSTDAGFASYCRLDLSAPGLTPTSDASLRHRLWPERLAADWDFMATSLGLMTLLIGLT